MTDAELLTECKKGLAIPVASTGFDGVLNQKLLAVKSYMKRAGVNDVIMIDDLAVGIIVMGVADLWSVGGGEIKFSPVFNILLSQLAMGSSVLTLLSNPVNGSVAIAINVQPVLTFNNRIVSHKTSMVNYDTLIPITITSVLDITGKILTIKPSGNLSNLTKYAIVVDTATAFSGQTLNRTVVSFTTI